MTKVFRVSCPEIGLHKKFLLENRKESYGVVALLEKELDLTKVTLELNEIDTFTTAITTRKAEL